MKQYINIALLIYLITINAAGFLLMLIDKKRSRRGKRRIPERVLLGVAALGGSVGAMAAMEIFRHKTAHPTFYIGLPVMIVVHVALILLGFFLAR